MNERQQAALAELAQKSLVDIQRETAIAWAYRAWAANSIAYGGLNGVMFHDAVEYEHEALEHAALSGDDNLLIEVRAIIRGER